MKSYKSVAAVSAMRSAMRVGVDPRNSADTIGQRYRKLMVDRLRRLDARQAKLMSQE